MAGLGGKADDDPWRPILICNGTGHLATGTLENKLPQPV